MGCEAPVSTELPVLGPYKVTDKVVDGVLQTDTVFTKVRPFQFWDQDSNRITEQTLENRYYVTDFFFTSCPTICPKMKQQMLRLHEAYLDEEDVLLLSHSIDPKRDSVSRLKTFAEKLDIQTDKWHMVTGNRDSIYSMAKHYMIAAQKDDKAPGGFAHSGAFLLVDKSRQIRGIYDGTDPEDVDQLMNDLNQLLGNESKP
ncbi:MAG: SCO family protein [Salibacteraceae bacterium]